MKRLLFVLSAVLVAGAASAQVKDAFDVHVGDVGLLQAKQVQTEVGITAAQRAKLNVAAAALTKRQEEYRKQLQALGSVTPDKTKLIGFLQILKKDVFAVLTPAQGHRLAQLTLQRIGLLALTDPIVGSRVGLSNAQVESLKKAFNAGKARFVSLQQETAKPILAPYQGKKAKDEAERTAWQRDIQAKMQQAGARLQPQLLAIGKQTDTAMGAVLTAPQKAKWAALKGKPFLAK